MATSSSPNGKGREEEEEKRIIPELLFVVGVFLYCVHGDKSSGEESGERGMIVCNCFFVEPSLKEKKKAHELDLHRYYVPPFLRSVRTRLKTI